MCTQKPPNDYSQQLYEKYREAFVEYINSTVRSIDFFSHDNWNLLDLLCCCCSILQFVFFFIRFCLLYERGMMSLCWGSLWKDGRITNLWLGGSHGSSIISTVILLPEGRYLDFMKLVWCASVIWFVSCISYIIIDNIIVSFLFCFLHIFVLLVIYFCFCWQ